jgi:hypothetical protein
MALFHALWVGLFLLLDGIAITVAPNPEASYGYFLAFLPLSYAAFLIVLAPGSD